MELLLLYFFCSIQLCLCIYNVDYRKAIYIEFQPETGQGKTTKKKEVTALSFTEDTAKKTGESKRTIEREAKTGQLESLSDEIVEAGIDDSQKCLPELVKVKEKAPDRKT